MSTIVALSTPMGKGAIAVVRMSGSGSIDIAKQLFFPFPKQANYLNVGRVQLDKDVFDRAMCVYFLSPRSYTGEDSVEFHLHGGYAVASAVIERCIERGARLAEPGEFSKRAFIGGKQNLSQAEGIAEVIGAESAMQLKTATELAQNVLGKQISALQDRLLDAIASVEASLDYPEEDIEEVSRAKSAEVVTFLAEQIGALLATANKGRMITNGVNAVLCGKVNVGKSSLLNALLGQDRAIVSVYEGTTRDCITECVEYKGLLIRYCDTAGLRETGEEIEQEGIKRTYERINNADVVLFVTDQRGGELICDAPVIKIYNKCDLLQDNYQKDKDTLYVSAKTGYNIDAIKEAVFDAVEGGNAYSNTVLTCARHVDVLRRAHILLAETHAIINSVTVDVISQYLTTVWQTLGEISGTTATEAVIDRIYQKFCLGK